MRRAGYKPYATTIAGVVAGDAARAPDAPSPGAPKPAVHGSYTASTGTLLLVLSYQFVSGGEDFARLWVNPDPTKTEEENSGAGGTVGNALKVIATATDGHGSGGARGTHR